MSTVTEIKSAAHGLGVVERLELFRWLAAQDDIMASQRTDLIADLDDGLIEADRGELLSGAEMIARLSARARQAE